MGAWTFPSALLMSSSVIKLNPSKQPQSLREEGEFQPEFEVTVNVQFVNAIHEGKPFCKIRCFFKNNQPTTAMPYKSQPNEVNEVQSQGIIQPIDGLGYDYSCESWG